jgi:hypothetical protein
MNKLQQIEQKMKELQAELEEAIATMKKEEATTATLGSMLPAFEGGALRGYCLDGYNFEPISGSIAEEDDQNIFPDKETAEGYADALRVMTELRRCEGSGIRDVNGDGDGFMVGEDGFVDNCYSANYFALCPPFSTEELLQAAVEKVGMERISNAYKFLAGVKD